MKKSLLLLLTATFVLTTTNCSSGGFLDKVIEEATKPSSKASEEDTFVAGLKEALDVGTRKAVEQVSVTDGYFANLDIKIPVPAKLEKAESLLRSRWPLHRCRSTSPIRF